MINQKFKGNCDKYCKQGFIMFIGKVLELHLAWQGPRCPICFPRVCECLIQVLMPFTHPQRVERDWQVMQAHCSSCYLKIRQCLVFEKMISKYSLGSHTTQPTGKAHGPTSWVMTWYFSLMVFAQLGAIKMLKMGHSGHSHGNTLLGVGRGVGMV